MHDLLLEQARHRRVPVLTLDVLQRVHRATSRPGRKRSAVSTLSMRDDGVVANILVNARFLLLCYITHSFRLLIRDRLVREHLIRPAQSELASDVRPVADRVLHQLLDIDLSLKRRNETRELVHL